MVCAFMGGSTCFFGGLDDVRSMIPENRLVPACRSAVVDDSERDGAPTEWGARGKNGVPDPACGVAERPKPRSDERLVVVWQ